MNDLSELLIGPALLLGAVILVIGLYAFAELWQGKNDDDRKGKK